LPVLFFNAQLAVYNSKGELANSFQFIFNATGLNSGVYYLRLIAGEVNQAQKIVLIK